MTLMATYNFPEKVLGIPCTHILFSKSSRLEEITLNLSWKLQLKWIRTFQNKDGYAY